MCKCYQDTVLHFVQRSHYRKPFTYNMLKWENWFIYPRFQLLWLYWIMSVASDWGVIVDHLWKGGHRGKPKYSEKPPFQCHSVHHKQKMDRTGTEPRPCVVELAINRLSRGKTKTITMLRMMTTKMTTITVYFMSHFQICSNSSVMIIYSKIMSFELPVNLELH
jgi:hypothetical protein